MEGKTRTSNHNSFLAFGNFIFLKLAVLLCVLCIAGYFLTDFEPVRNGGTWMGYTLGIIATLLILLLTFLGLRKRIFRSGRWSLKSWTSAHIYLGLSLIIIATLHTGFQFGWNIHTLAYALMMAVIISGLFGIYYYAVIPRKMSDNRGEMSQAAMLDEIVNLDRLLQETAQPLDDVHISHIQKSTKGSKTAGGLFNRLSAEKRRCPTQTALTYFQSEVHQSEGDMRMHLLDTIFVLERKNALLKRIRLHVRYRALLELWLFFHIPLTFALLAALAAHIVSVFYFS